LLLNFIIKFESDKKISSLNFFTKASSGSKKRIKTTSVPKKQQKLINNCGKELKKSNCGIKLIEL
jgi:hypothetical protein